MASQPVPPESPVFSCIHVSGSSDHEDHSGNSDMDSSSSDSGDNGASSDRDERGSPASPGAMQAHRPNFVTGSHGPLGAKAIVDNMQILKSNLKEMDDLMGSAGSGGDDSAADEAQMWAELHADVERLTRRQDDMRNYIRETTLKADLRLAELDRGLARFAGMADIDSQRLLLIRDKLPANLGPALARLVAFCYQDDDSIKKMPRRFRDLMSKDSAVLLQQAVPLAPSQDVSALRRDLEHANDQLDLARADACSKEKTIDSLVYEKEKAVVTKEKLRTSMAAMSKKHAGELDELKGRVEDSSRSAKKYANKFKDMRERANRQSGMLVEAQEEKQRLQAQVTDAQQEATLRGDRIKELGDRVDLLVSAEKGSNSAFHGLKRTIELQNQQLTLNQDTNEKIINDMRARNEAEQAQQRQRITQLEKQAEGLHRENREVGALRQDKERLERDVVNLKSKATTMKEKQDRLTSEKNGLWDEKLDLSKQKGGLEVRVQETESRLEQLNKSYKELQASDASNLRLIERLNRTIEGNDSERITAQQRLDRARSSWEEKYNDLLRRNAELGLEVEESEDAIRKAKVLVQGETKLKAEVARWKRDAEGRTREVEDAQAKLSGAEERNGSLAEELDTLKGNVETLRADAEHDKAAVDDLTRQRSKDHERMRDLEASLQQAKAEKDAQLVTATNLKNQVATKDEEVLRLVSQLTISGANESDKERLLGEEREEVKRLQELVADTENSLESERQVSKGLVEKRAELESSIQRQKLEADESLRALHEENLKLQASVSTLQGQQEQSAGEIGRLQRALQCEAAGREQDQARYEQGHQDLAKRSEGQEEDLRRRDLKLQELEDEISSMRRSLSDSTAEAQQSLEGLQNFIARLCLAPAEDSAAFEGLARRLQAPATQELVPTEQQRGPEWTILEPWDDKPEEDIMQPSGGLEVLVLQLFHHAVTGRLGSRRCYHALQQTVKVVNAGTVIHTGVLGETSKAFVSAILADPEEGFQAGLIFWQVLTAVGRTHDHADIEAARVELTGALGAHGYSSIFRLVSGHEQLSEGDECHFFSGKYAVVARPAASSAALVDTEGKSVRFFARRRWTAGVWGFTIKPPANQSGLFLQSNSRRDIEWAKVMRAC